MNFNIIGRVNANSFTRLKGGRKCSFCSNFGHTITKCDDIQLCIFKTYLFYIKANIHYYGGYNNNSINEQNNIFQLQLEPYSYIHTCINKIEKMEEFLYEYCSTSEENIKMIKSFACRFCSCRLRSRLQISINKIIVFLFDLNCDTLINNELMNSVPFNEDNPIRISRILNCILMNCILMNWIFPNRNNDNQNHQNQQNQQNIKIIYDMNLDSSNEKNDIIECSICYNEYAMKDCLTFNCKHTFCLDCTNELIKNKHTKCPNCRCEINEITCHNNITHKYVFKTI
jgi:hypothetical protein